MQYATHAPPPAGRRGVASELDIILAADIAAVLQSLLPPHAALLLLLLPDQVRQCCVLLAHAAQGSLALLVRELCNSTPRVPRIRRAREE